MLYHHGGGGRDDEGFQDEKVKGKQLVLKYSVNVERGRRHRS